MDPLSSSFAPDDHHKFDPSKIEIAGNIVNLDQIKKDVAYITSQDKELVMGMLVSVNYYNQNSFKIRTCKNRIYLGSKDRIF